MTILKTIGLAVLCVALLIVLAIPVLMTLGLVVLFLARVNPVLGFVGLVVAVAIYRVVTQSKPRWFLE